MDRFDLEQGILNCWRITQDIPDLEALGATAADMTALATVYEFHFQKLWNIFEHLVQNYDITARNTVNSEQEFFERGLDIARELDQQAQEQAHDTP